MDISQLSKKTGIASSKIRYYEKIGLITSTGRNGLKRVFGKNIITNLSFISLAQSCGFSLKEVLMMVSNDRSFKLNKNKINSKIIEIDEKIKELNKMKKTLEHLSNCKEKNHFECQNFQKILKKVKISNK